MQRVSKTLRFSKFSFLNVFSILTINKTLLKIFQQMRYHFNVLDLRKSARYDAIFCESMPTLLGQITYDNRFIFTLYG